MNYTDFLKSNMLDELIRQNADNEVFWGQQTEK